MTVSEQVLAARRTAGLFTLEDRGLLSVSGSDATRWLGGMITGDVAALSEGPEHSGCPALVLTHRGRIVADVQVLALRGGFWLEVAGAASAAALRDRLSKLVIADDVRLVDESAATARFGVEGPRAWAAVEAAAGSPLGLAPDACREAVIGGSRVVVARFGWSGEDAYQIFSASGDAQRVREGLLASAAGAAPVVCGPEALEVLRIEAGRPRMLAELSEEILPPEARLDRWVSYTKGCYIGQEIIARLRSRGHVNHLLVGLRLDAERLPGKNAPVRAGDKVVGEVTSSALSPRAGRIALAFVRVGHDAPGTELDVDGARAQVAALPFVEPATPAA